MEMFKLVGGGILTAIHAGGGQRVLVPTPTRYTVINKLATITAEVDR